MVCVLSNGLRKKFFRKDYKERVLPHSGLLEPIRIETILKGRFNPLFKKPG
jgi:hypothetical protein